MNVFSRIILMCVPVMMLAVMVSAQAQYPGAYHQPNYNYTPPGSEKYSGGSTAITAPKTPVANPAPAGFGGQGVLPTVGTTLRTQEPRTLNNALGDDNLLTPEDISSLSGGLPGGVPKELNPYRPTGKTDAAGKKNTGTMPINPYQPTQPRINSVNVQYGTHTPQNVQKPFSDYKPEPNFSPWMNLYRSGNNTGIDNYNFYVRPALEAEQEKRQMQEQVRTLQAQQNATAVQQQHVGAYGAVYGQVNSGVGASYGFPGHSGVGGDSGVTLANPQNQGKETIQLDKDSNLNMPDYRTINPYAPFWDNPAYAPGMNPYNF